MDAKERVLKALNHEEADRVPYWEASIDNLKICEHYGSKYGFQGVSGYIKIIYYLSFGNTKLMTKYIRAATRRKFVIKTGLKKKGLLPRRTVPGGSTSSGVRCMMRMPMPLGDTQGMQGSSARQKRFTVS